MTPQEFSDSFDTMLNSYYVGKAINTPSPLLPLAFDEYEKSLFLTQAQDDYVISIYSGKNQSRDSFEVTEEIRRYLSPLIVEGTLSPEETERKHPVFSLPDNLWFITYESVDISNGKCTGHTSLEVVPTSQDEYHRVKNNPFRGANDRRALRFDLSDNRVEIVSKYDISSYNIKYLRKPYPIIREDISPLSINGEHAPLNSDSACELHEAAHQKILEMAGLLAVRSRGYNLNSNRE